MPMDQTEGPEGPASIERLYERYGTLMFHYLLAVLGRREDVEDVLQEVFVNLTRYRENLERACSSRAYAMTVLRHEALRHLGRRREITDYDFSLLEARPESSVTSEEARRLQTALAALPLEQREVVVMKFYEGLHFSEIAEIVGTPIATVASRYRYALEKLRAILGRQAEED